MISIGPCQCSPAPPFQGSELDFIDREIYLHTQKRKELDNLIVWWERRREVAEFGPAPQAPPPSPQAQPQLQEERVNGEAAGDAVRSSRRSAALDGMRRVLQQIPQTPYEDSQAPVTPMQEESQAPMTPP